MLKTILLASILITTTGCTKLKNFKFIKREKPEEEIRQVVEASLKFQEKDLPLSLDPLSCPITPTILEAITLPPIYKSNNLRKRIGYSNEAGGEKIIISGIITDASCRPIGNARVDIWQADFQGYYKTFQPNPYLNDQRLYKKSGLRFTENYDSSWKADENFTGSGSMTSNNLGQFYFLTIKPGGKESPKIHIRITHKSFPEFNSLLFFPENNKANSLQKPAKILKSLEKNYYYKITLPVENSVKDY
jgi:protocatechuate 3,4-dioxygenase beta subunit